MLYKYSYLLTYLLTESLGKGAAEKMSLETTARKLGAGMVQTWRYVVIRRTVWKGEGLQSLGKLVHRKLTAVVFNLWRIQRGAAAPYWLKICQKKPPFTM